MARKPTSPRCSVWSWSKPAATVCAASRGQCQTEARQLRFPFITDTAMHPDCGSTHWAPHALPTTVSSGSQAHVTALQRLVMLETDSHRLRHLSRPMPDGGTPPAFRVLHRHIHASRLQQHAWGTSCPAHHDEQWLPSPRVRPAAFGHGRNWQPPSAPPLAANARRRHCTCVSGPLPIHPCTEAAAAFM